MTTTRLSEIRKQRAVGAAELARLAGISRQTVYAIEDGSYTPNTAVALALARVLAVRVEDLFSLVNPPEQLVDAPAVVLRQAGEPETQVVRYCRVNDRLVAAPAPGFLAYLPAGDGDLRIATERLLVAGCDPALSLLAEAMKQVSAVELVAVPTPSRTAVEWLRQGVIHVAGIHLFDSDTGAWNVHDDDFAAITFAHWEQGFACRRNTATPVRRFADLGNRRVRLMNREAGAGSRELLDSGLAAEGLASGQVRGYRTEGHGHLAVAYAVATGQADCCLTNSAAARFYNLEFAPLRTERFDLLVRKETLEVAGLRILQDQLCGAALRQRLASVGGYSTGETGQRQL